MKTVALIFTSETFLSNPASESCECTCMHDIFKTNKYYIIILPLHITWPKCFCLFVCSCVRLLPLIRCKLRQILVTHDHWAVRVLYGTGYPFIWSSLRTRGYETHTSCRAFGNGALPTWVCRDRGSNTDLLHARWMLYQLNHRGRTCTYMLW